MKLMKPLLFATLAFLSFVTSALSANLVVNPGFEDPITSDGPPFVGFWEGFNGGAGSSAANSSLMPLSGLQSLRLAIVNTDNTFAGTFQDIPSVTPGVGYIFSGWHVTTSSPLDLTVEVRIEWRNSGSDTEISRTPNSTPVPGMAYSPFDLTATVPVGADTARLVYAIQTFTGGPSNNGTVFVDDISFQVVPEPSTFVLGAAGGLALMAMRRWRA